jgi:hypothetical protein
MSERTSAALETLTIRIPSWALNKPPFYVLRAFWSEEGRIPALDRPATTG